jgi:kynureninase
MNTTDFELTTDLTREACLQLDAIDPLAAARQLFQLPKGVIYLDGNSLGALPKAVAAVVQKTVTQEWGDDLITSWNKAGWMNLPQEIGALIAPLVGAADDEVVVADSTSINLFKVLADALQRQTRASGSRRKIISERGNFPTDLYMAQGLSQLLNQGHELVLLDELDAQGTQLSQVLGDDTAVVMLTQVDYRSGRKLNMAAITRKVQAAGALAIWDLAHSAGAFSVDLTAANADYAVGCGYKYLNGGPGAPSFIYVAKRHQTQFTQPLAGWLGHAAPFDFEPDYRPAPGLVRAICGSPTVLSLIALRAALQTFHTAIAQGGLNSLANKSTQLTQLFINLAAPLAAKHGLQVVTPKDSAQRGSQVSFALVDGQQAYSVVQALIKQGVIGDFRAPNILRFGFAPLYLSYVDVFDAYALLAHTLDSGLWREPQFQTRNAVT